MGKRVNDTPFACNQGRHASSFALSTPSWVVATGDFNGERDAMGAGVMKYDTNPNFIHSQIPQNYHTFVLFDSQVIE